MNAFMTNGTFDFLKKLEDKHPKIDFFYMNGESSTLVYYEADNKKSVFSSGRAYASVIETGQMQKSGFVVMNNISVTEDGTETFEERFKLRQQNVDSMPGFQAFRLLRPKSGNTYVVLTQWATETDFENWKNSDQFKKAHKDGGTKPPAYFADRPFITTYRMINMDE
ncbi:antibiotic biosynthesis monooxygenase family protein [Virgibacillus doumboii]|uniref:antibiotic biosynthesis monooxygenase family protein n=1 Tax=Virgibacillus doumboii TaxID=2697503 RepID=UPI0013DECA60|nr:antibiotic biosynthesis monooxygenase [Virgibacillus doumboii]